VANEPELLDIAQAAALLQVSEASLRRWTNSGRLACFRVGGRRERRFRRADLLALLERNPDPPQTGHLCGFYTSDRAQTRYAARALADGLRAGSVCLLVGAADLRERVVARLGRQRRSLRRDMDAGRLAVAAYAEGVSAQLKFWEMRFEAAMRAGASRLQVVGDIRGDALAGHNSFDAVLEYEAGYGKLSRRFPVATMCLYDARAYSGVETASLLQLHPDLFRHPTGELLT
jgi:transcriptional repressor of dcmA and dcmR